MPDALILMTLRKLIGMGLDLIPLQPGGKRPSENAWNKPCARKIDTVAKRFGILGTGPDADIATAHFCATKHNIGVLNESSKIITVDCDDARAPQALQAAAEALGGDVADLETGAWWMSRGGPKVIFRRPNRMKAGRTVFRVWNHEANAYDVIFELRGTGQDVLPGSVRADWRDADGQPTQLEWGAPVRTPLPEMPRWLRELYAQLAAGRGPAVDAMHDALGVDALARRGAARDMAGYPADCAGAVAERAWINERYWVTDLLTSYGYQRHGTQRWAPAGSTKSPGIIPPRAGHDENWLCEHEGDVLAGIFDAWRIIVEHEYAGDVDAALLAVRADMRSSVSETAVPVKPAKISSALPAPDPAPPIKPREKKTNKAASKKSRGKPPPDTAVDVPASPIDGETDHGGNVVHSKPPSRKHDGKLSASFLLERFLRPRQVISGLLNLSPGMHLLSAMPKVGKSILVTSMAMTAVTGVSISQFTVDAPMPVLYLALDESVDQTFRPRVQKLVQKFGLKPTLIEKHLRVFDNAADLVTWADDAGISTMEALPFEVPQRLITDEMSDEEAEAAWAHNAMIRSVYSPVLRALYHYLIRHKIRFVVVDVIGKLRLLDNSNRNAYVRDLQEWSAMNELCIYANAAGVAVHHMNKQGATKLGAGESHLGRVSGTNAQAGAVQSVTSISRVIVNDMNALRNLEPAGNKVLLVQDARDSAGREPTALSLRAEPLDGWPAGDPALWFDVMGDALLLENDDLKQAIGEYLYDQPGTDWIPSAAILASLKTAGLTALYPRAAPMQALRQMTSSGDVEARQGVNGGYRLAPWARKAIAQRRQVKGY